MSAPAYCTTCSEELEEGLRFCTSCGTPVDEVDDADEVDEPTEAQPVQSAAQPVAERPEPADVVIRRGTRRSPLLPPLQYDDDDESDVVISRSWATVARNRAIPNQVGKARKIAGDLPAWEPLPPGEAVITRRAPKRAK